MSGAKDLSGLLPSYGRRSVSALPSSSSQADRDACLMAARMRGYVPQRQILSDMSASISASVGLGLLSIRATADMTGPAWQYTTCTTSTFSPARWIITPLSVSPIASMVVTFLPTQLDTGVMQDRMGRPSRCTVHAPHKATPQPNFVPVRPTT